MRDEPFERVEAIREVLEDPVGSFLAGDSRVALALDALDGLVELLQESERLDEALEVEINNVGDLTIENLRIAGVAEAAEARLAGAVERLKVIQSKQPEMLKIIKSNGFVFEDIGNEPGNWQHLAFTIYSQLCEIESIATVAIVEARP